MKTLTKEKYGVDSLNSLSLIIADKKYDDEPGFVIKKMSWWKTIRIYLRLYKNRVIKVYNRSKYRIDFEVENVPKPSFIKSFICGFRGANIQVDRERVGGQKVQRFSLPPVKDPMDAIMKPIHITGGSYRITSWMNGIKRDDARILRLNEYPVFQNRHYEEIRGKKVDPAHKREDTKRRVLWNPFSWL
jgi:hypothetical protein